MVGFSLITAESFLTLSQYKDLFHSCLGGLIPYSFIPANLPISREMYRIGNGERIWIIIDSPTYADFKRDISRGTFYAYLANPSVYHPGLNALFFDSLAHHVRSFRFEHRGTSAPILGWATLESLVASFDPRCAPVGCYLHHKQPCYNEKDLKLVPE